MKEPMNWYYVMISLTICWQMINIVWQLLDRVKHVVNSNEKKGIFNEFQFGMLYKSIQKSIFHFEAIIL